MMPAQPFGSLWAHTSSVAILHRCTADTADATWLMIVGSAMPAMSASVAMDIAIASVMTTMVEA